MKNQVAVAFIGTIFLCLLGWYIDSLAHQAIYEAINAFVYVGTMTGLSVLVVTGALFIWVAIERARLARAKRRIVERESKVLVVKADEREQVYVREMDKQATWRPLHLNPAQYQNGKPAEPSAVELTLYRLFHSRPQFAAPEPLLLEAPPQIPELLPILDNAQRCLIIGASDSGKTTVLQWVVSRRAGSVIVIDPHASPGKWGKAKVIGIGSNFSEIETTLDNLIELMVRRYKEIGQGLVREMEHPRLTVIIDEWMSIAYQCRNAHDTLVRLLTESRKAAFSIIIGSHSERVKSLGLDGKGDLKDGFLFIRLYLENGERRATFDYGRGERPCLLPGKYYPAEDQVLEIEAIARPVPTAEETQILEMAARGDSNRTISQAVWGEGKHGQFYNQKIQEVLEKYSEKRETA